MEDCNRTTVAATTLRDRVLSQPCSRLTLHHVAEEYGISVAGLHKAFARLHGENYGTFSRRRRLEYACSLMRAFPSASCTKIAHEAGYSESSDFTRSFKRRFLVPPSAWNRITPLHSLRMRTWSDGLVIPCFPPHPSRDDKNVLFTSLPAERIATITTSGILTIGRLYEMFDRLEAWLAQHDQIRASRKLIGLSDDSRFDTDPNMYRYQLAYPVDEELTASGDISIRTLPGTLAASVSCRGGIPEFIQSWDLLLRHFLPTSPYGPGPGPRRAIYLNDPRRDAMRYWDMKVFLPIARH